MSKLFTRGAAMFVALICAHAASAAGQAAPFTGTTLQQTVAERWRNAGQPESATRFETRTQTYRVARDERTSTGAVLVVRANLTGLDSALLSVGARGDVRVQHYMRTLSPAVRAMLRDTMRMRRFALVSGGRSRMNLVMPDARIWDLARSAPENLRVGFQWIDTLRLETAQDGARHTVTGTRVSRVVRDTVADGRGMFIVRDSAAVVHEERFLIEAYMLDTTERVDRRASGIIRGQWLLDPRHGFVRWSADTTALGGTATLTAADGRTVSSPAQFERTREVVALTAAEFAARQSAVRPFSIVRVPFTALEKRMELEGPAITDSLFLVVRTSTSAREKDSLLTLIEQWGRVPRARMIQEALFIGDTVRAIEAMDYLPELTSPAMLRSWLPIFGNPDRLWRFGRTADAFSELVARRLRESPPLTAVSAPATPDDAPGIQLTVRDVACIPDACRILADLWPAARDTRLRAVGLLTRAMRDPRGWGDSLRRNVALAPGILRPALALLDGVGAGWPASSKTSLPAPVSDWRRWSEWMTGQTPGTLPPRDSSGQQRPPGPITRMEESHHNAIAVNSAATGRPIAAELRNAFRAATEDSARLVFGTLAINLNAIPVTSDLVARWLTDSSPLIVSLGRNALYAFVRDSASRLSDAEATPLVDSLLAQLIDRAPRWAPLGDSAGMRGFPPEMTPGTIRLRDDSLPVAVVARWSSRIRRVVPGERGVPDDQLPATTYTVSRPRGAGRILVLGFSLMTQRGSRAYAQGSTYYLLLVDGVYRLVAVSSWIT